MDIRQTWLQCPCKRERKPGCIVRGRLLLVCHVCAKERSNANA